MYSIACVLMRVLQIFYSWEVAVKSSYTGFATLSIALQLLNISGQCGVPSFLDFMHLTMDLNRGHELVGLHHLTRSNIAVIYCNNFQYGQGDKIQHLCHGCPVYSQAQVPAFKFTSPEQKAKSATSSEPRSDRGSAGIELGRYKSAVKWFGQTLYHIVKEQGFLRNN
jgi:hypothetical protein